MFSQKFLISALILAGCCAFPASASSLTPCTTPACFTTATGGDTFNNISVAAGNLGTVYASLGVDFSDPAGLIGMTALAGWPAGGAIVANAGVNTLTITLPTAVSALDFYVSLGAGGYDYFTISATDSTGGTYTNGGFFSTPSSEQFFGISTTSTFSTFTITSQSAGDQITLDDISIGSAAADPAPTPEAATLLLVGTGLFLMGYGRRWLTRRAPQDRSAQDGSIQAARRGTVRTMSTGITPA